MRRQFGLNRAVGLLLLWVSAGLGVRAQVNTADVVVTVTDSSGAAVPSAVVTITNAGTNVSRTINTGDAGAYTFRNLQVGVYNLRVQAPGFAPYDARDARLAAGDQLRLNAKLTVGAKAESIEVSATAAALQTESSTVSALITDKAVQDLPLNGRNFINLVQLSPGVAEGLPVSFSSGNRPDDRRQSSSYTANGQTDIVNNNLIDGMDNNERSIGTIGVRPSIEAIQEVRVQTNIYTAEVGRAAGAVVDLITKSGTNKFHGSVFEFLRNSALDARSFFAPTTEEEHQNQFGASLGGPIVKDKTFFFGDYEGFRQVRGLTGTTTVPTLFEQQNPGNFSDIGGPTIPKSQFDPVGLAYFKMYPKPTSPGTVNNYTASPIRTQDSDTFDTRIDHHVSQNKLLFARYSFNNVNTFTPPILPKTTISTRGGSLTLYPGDGVGGGQTTFPGQSRERQQNAAAAFQDVLRPNLLLDIKVGYLRSNIESDPLNYGTDVATQIGFPCNSTSCINVPGNIITSGLPTIYMAGTAYQSLGDPYALPLTIINNSYMLTGSMTWTKGAHNIKTGAGITARQLGAGQSIFPQGFYLMIGGFTQTGNLLGDLITGQMANVQRWNTLNDPFYSTKEPNAYVQDDWHIKRWLTLNIGLRYDVFTPFTERYGQFSNFDTATGLLISPSLPGAQKSGSTAGVKTDYRDLAPRFGFAATLGHGTVLRGGFGMTYWPGNYTAGALMKGAPYTYQFGCGLTSAVPCGSFATSSGYFPSLSAGLPPPVVDLTTATDPSKYAGTIVSSTDFNYRSSYLEQFSIQLQKELAGNIVSIGYIGNLGRHLTAQPNINQNGYGGGPLPYPALDGVTLLRRESAGISNYHAMQIMFQRRLSGGLAVNGNYTNSHSTGNTQVTDEGQGGATTTCVGYCLVDNPSGPGHPSIAKGWQQYDYGNSDLDIRHRVTAMVNYDLPFGENLKGVAGVLGKGWSVNLIGAWQTGFPQTVLNASAVSGIVGLSADRPDQVGSVSLSNPTLQEWFNTSAFVQQTKGTLGDERRNQVFGPPQRGVNVSVFKLFDIRESMRVQFRMEAFNLTNTANFAGPGANLGAANFGIISATTPGSTPREIQFALKLLF
jgi:Carboxypeptidase regulatory-like domain